MTGAVTAAPVAHQTKHPKYPTERNHMRYRTTIAAAAVTLAALAAGATAAHAAPAPVIAVTASFDGSTLGASPVALAAPLLPGASETVTFTASGGDGQALTWDVVSATGYGASQLSATASGAQVLTVANPAGLPVTGSVTVAVTDGDDTTTAVVTIGEGGATADLGLSYARASSAVPVLSKGHAVSTANTREDVAYTASKPGWTYFAIVGPGAINGHQGWVDDVTGLNEGVYTGLLYGHGYAVYFTPVAARGSTVPQAGARTGHVYFVTGK